MSTISFRNKGREALRFELDFDSLTRSNRIAVTSDIKAAFLQIEIHEDDRDYTRFFWSERPTTEENLQVFRLTRVLFGVTSSPFLLNATIKYHLKRWSLIQQMRKKFWDRWTAEYLNHLQSRLKWTKRNQDLEVDQLVLLKEPNKTPLEWALARVTRVHPGPDGAVRVLDIKTSRGTFRRAITCVVPLPISRDVGQPSNGGRDVQCCNPPSPDSHVDGRSAPPTS
ncbi:unnamed protein product [Larinioides sclopetarius]|uniref:DUF5641 domain-containing protein n=3 Tax=Larinioides sclopetarius TaxID=280406 RepID=A0AAV2AG77_9ARAC